MAGPPSVVTSKPAIHGHLKTGKRNEPRIGLFYSTGVVTASLIFADLVGAERDRPTRSRPDVLAETKASAPGSILNLSPPLLLDLLIAALMVLTFQCQYPVHGANGAEVETLIEQKWHKQRLESDPESVPDSDG